MTKYGFKATVKPSQNRRGRGPEIPEGLLKRCNSCKAAVYVEEARQRDYTCPHCGAYFRLPAQRRIGMIADPDSFMEWDTGLQSPNPLESSSYPEKLRTLRDQTGLDEAVITGRARIQGISVVLGVCDVRFLMGSMGRVAGEKITRAVERATEERLPVILFACSGGARMQEGIVSLMQMAKTAAALKRHSDAGLLYISVLTDPTTGGVTASFAMLGDVICAEPGALIGFAGPRVIEQTIRQKLPKDFQRSEFLLEHGFLDAVVERGQLRDWLGNMLRLHGTDGKSADGQEGARNGGSVSRPAEEKPAAVSAWEHVTRARDKDRPVGCDYIRGLFTDFTELHGDRGFRDDPSVVGGIAFFQGFPVTVLAQEKGRGTRESIARNFGMVSPEGYRKALRLMKQAEKFGRPVICFVDTPGAFCGTEAEERGQGEAIARSLYELSSLKVPVLSVVIGEGGSGGALAFALADQVWMLEHAVYSILSPEGFASILWKDSSRAQEAAEVMKMTSWDLKQLGIVERVIREPERLTRETMEPVLWQLEEGIRMFLAEYGAFTPEELAEGRYRRFRGF